MENTHLVSGISCGPRRTNTNRANGSQRKNGSLNKNASRCLRPGPIGRNPYLNFLRDFRKNNCGFSAIETVRRGAEAWNKLPDEKRTQYIVEAFYAKRLRRRPTHQSTGGSSRLRGTRQGRVRKSRRRRSTSSAKSAAKTTRRSRVCARPRPQRRIC